MVLQGSRVVWRFPLVHVFLFITVPYVCSYVSPAQTHPHHMAFVGMSLPCTSSCTHPEPHSNDIRPCGLDIVYALRTWQGEECHELNYVLRAPDVN